MNRLLFSLFLFAIFFVLVPSAGLAQSATAALSGTVIDSSNAYVAGATVTLQNAGTGIKRTTATDSAGSFTMPLLPPGQYVLTVAQAGFATITNRNLILNVGDQRSVVLQLRVSGLAAEMSITAEAALLNESPGVGTIINRDFVENLPLNGRTLQSLIQLAPGVVQVASDGFQTGQFSANGQRESANYFTVDGVSANIGINNNFTLRGSGGQYAGYNALGTTTSLVSLDALQEFRIQTSTFAAEFGRTPGAQVTLVSRSGTNALRGSLFNYFRNDALDANDWFANRAGIAKPALRQNQFGGVLGGPIVKDRSFFFFSYEGLRLRLPQVGVRAVPSQALRDQARGALREVLKAFPKPTGSDFADGSAELTAGYSDASTTDAYAIRLDYRLSNGLTIFGRYNESPSRTNARGPFGYSLSTIDRNDLDTRTLTAGATWTATPRVINEFRFNWSRFSAARDLALDNFGGAAPFNDGSYFPAGLTRQDANAGFSFLGDAVGIWIGKIADNTQRQVNLADTLSWARSGHELKFGADWRRLLPILRSNKYGQFYVFDDLGQAGIVPFVQIDALVQPIEPSFDNWSFFAQDTWKASRRLTLTYGLRYEINPAPRERNNFEAIALAENSGLTPATARLAPRGSRSLFETTWNNFAPRIGAAYLLNNAAGRETMLRGGFGIFYDLTSGQIGGAYDRATPAFAATRYVENAPFPLTPQQTSVPAFNFGPPYDYLILFDPKLKLPYTLQWSAAVEQSLGAGQSVSATYVGAAGRRLYYTESVPGPIGDFNDFDIVRNLGRSDYHALQLQYQRRLTAGLQALASYAWSHAIDTGSTDVRLGNLASSGVENERGSADFDLRHTMNAAVSYSFPKSSRHGVLATILNGWGLDGIMRAFSAPPVNVFQRVSRGASINGLFLRPDIVAGVPQYLEGGQYPGGKALNPAAFRVLPAETLRQGTLGRNALRGFGLTQLDLSARRFFGLTERLNLLFRCDLFNLFNQPNFGAPESNLRSGFFGQSTQMRGRSLGGLNPLYQSGGPRSLQLSLKVSF